MVSTPLRRSATPLRDTSLRSKRKMVAPNNQQRFSEIFLRYGQVPLGSNADAEPLLKEVSLSETTIPERLSVRLSSDDVLSLGDSYGDPIAGDPTTFDFLRITMSDGRKKSRYSILRY